MKAPHFIYYSGLAEAECGSEKDAKRIWSRLSKTGASIMSAEDVFPYLALANLGGGDAKQKIVDAVESLKKRIASGDANPELIYAEGMLLAVLGKANESSTLLQQSAMADDPMVRYLSLAALNDRVRK
jgi:hypothetical protein